MLISPQTVQDPVNKYRHGVLIGNFVEDKFGIDLNAKGPNPDALKLTTTKDHHDIDHSLYNRNQFINSHQKTNSHFYETSKLVKEENYRRPEEETSYNIFHRKEVGGKVPVLENNPKREERLAKEGKLYDNTRYYLSNKFIKQEQLPNGGVPQILNEQIPDILTGQIWKGKIKPGSEEVDDKNKGKTKIQNSTNPKSINPFGTYSLIKPQLQRFEEVEYKKFVYPNEKGEHRDVLFGHGLSLQDFQKRQIATTYDLSFNQRVKPQAQVNSFYNPDPTKTAKQFHRETVIQKNHQATIPAFGDKTILAHEKQSRPYQPYTKTFDYNHLKNQYLRK